MQRVLPARFLAELNARTPDAELSRELSRDARRRVRAAAAIGALAFAAFLALELTGVLGGKALERRLDLIHDLFGLGVTLGLVLATSLALVPDRAVLAVALATELLLSAAISIHAPWTSYLRTQHVASLTWVVPVIVLFPLLVPARPRTMLAISVVCALTVPTGYRLLASLGAIELRTSDYWSGTVTALVAVGIAWIASATVHGARRQAAAVRRVGGYELIEKLGRGGMGEVWKARHLFLARPAAVKLILPERLQGPREQRTVAIERFTREARVTARLRSPHTVELFDFGVSSDGSLYYAMELLEGLNAEHFVYRFGPLAPHRAVYWLVQACHSLAEAHEQRLVHRDIKPANLFVCRYGRDADFVKVLDFGLTKPLGNSADARLTASGFRMGTPGYMAPEQVCGLSADPRTDLYALACVGYWLITGAKPFEAGAAGELMLKHAESPPPRLSDRAPGPVPEELEEVLLGCLSKETAKRPPSAEAMGAALEHSLGGERWSASDAHDWWEENLPAGTSS